MNTFFIVGVGRGGTKMLREMLICHPKLKVLIETHWLPSLYDRFGCSRINYRRILDVLIDSKYTLPKSWLEIVLESESIRYESFIKNIGSQFYSKEDVTIAEFMDVFFRFIYGDQPLLVGDKTPHYGMAVDEILEIWPDAKFIHLVRDGVFSAVSMRKHPGFRRQIANDLPFEKLDRAIIDKYPPLPDRDVSINVCLEFWGRLTNVIETKLQRVPAENRITVRYEDILQNPERGIDSILKFLGMEKDKRAIRRAALMPRPYSYKEYLVRAEYLYERHHATIAKTMADYGYEKPAPEVGQDYMERERSRYIRRLFRLNSPRKQFKRLVRAFRRRVSPK